MYYIVKVDREVLWIVPRDGDILGQCPLMFRIESHDYIADWETVWNNGLNQSWFSSVSQFFNEFFLKIHSIICLLSKRSYTWMGRFLYQTGHTLPLWVLRCPNIKISILIIKIVKMRSTLHILFICPLKSWSQQKGDTTDFLQDIQDLQTLQIL
jgi:hypothetical protein